MKKSTNIYRTVFDVSGTPTHCELVIRRPTTNEEFVFQLDLDDVELAKKHSWAVLLRKGKRRSFVYAVSNFKHGCSLSLHRLILNCPADKCVDHINGLTTDNRRSNIRICTNQENLSNSVSAKGYSWHKLAKKFRVTIIFKGESTWIGYFDTKEAARQAYIDAKQRIAGIALNQEPLN